MSLAKQLSRELLPLAENMSGSHVQVEKILFMFVLSLTSSFCGYVIHEARRKLNNKIITNSVHVPVEK